MYNTTSVTSWNYHTKRCFSMLLLWHDWINLILDHSEIPGSLKLFHCSYKWDLECISTFGASKSASIWYNSDTSKEDEKVLCSRMRIRKLLLKTKMGQIVDSKKFNNIVEQVLKCEKIYLVSKWNILKQLKHIFCHHCCKQKPHSPSNLSVFLQRKQIKQFSTQKLFRPQRNIVH